MLLRLIPEPPLPTILFTLAFGNLPDGVPYPAAWTSQLQHILHDELEMPQCIHAFDKAAWAACLLHEVTFSVAAQRVSVLFVDGTSVEWPLVDGALGRALKEVTDDVGESAIAVEMEQRRARAIQAAAQAQAAQERMPAAPSPSPANGKHKKSRSLLMTLVASFCPSSQSSPPALLPLPLAPPPPLTPLELEPPPPEPPQSSRCLRRKARGALVDIYRRYIIPVLALESPFSVSRSGAEGGGGYVLWNLQSILRRIEERMHLLGLELGSSSSSPASLSRSNSSSTSNPKRHRVSPSTLSESPFEEEEEDTSSASGTTEESESADTDASSVSAHTPRDALPAYPVLCAAPAQEDESVKKEGGIVNPATRLAPLAPSSSTSHQQTTPLSRRMSKRQSHPNRHPSTHVNNPQQQAQQHEYALLHASTIRLRALIARTSSFAHMQAEERNAALVLLERKSRRRAWSSKQLMGGSEVGMGMREGLGVPVRESSLRWCWMPRVSEGVRQKSESERLAYVGVPRMPGGSLAARREMETEMKIELPTPTPILVPAHRVPSQEGSVPFPQTEGDGGDDFCSTGPQDTSRLFGGVDGEGEEFESVVLEQTRGKKIMGGRAAYARSYSSDDLPGLFSSSSSSPPPSSDFEASAFEDSESEEMGTEFDRPFHTFEDGDSFDPPSDAFASALCFEEVSDFSMKFNKGTAGMGPRTRIHARRRAALSR